MIPNPERTSEAKAEGERRRDVGMALAAERGDADVKILRGQIALLEAILKSPERTATTDDVDPDNYLQKKFSDGGKWRGNIPRPLVKAGLIQVADRIKSNRSARHRGLLTLWRGTDDATLHAYLKRLRSKLATLVEADATPKTVSGRTVAAVRPEEKEENS